MIEIQQVFCSWATVLSRFTALQNPRMNLICMEIGKEYILASINMRVSEACYRQADNNVSVVDISAHLSPRIINTEPSLIVSTNEIQTKHCLVQHTILTYIDRSSVIESFLRERTHIYIYICLIKMSGSPPAHMFRYNVD